MYLESRKQQGSILLLSAVLLAVIGTLSITSMKSVIIESKITNKYKDASYAFNAAQSAAYVAEQKVMKMKDKDIPDPNPAKNYYIFKEGTDIEDFKWEVLAASPDEPIEDNTGETPVRITTRDASVTFYMGTQPIAGETFSEKGSEKVAGAEAHFFDIYGYAEGSEDSRRMIKIVYAKQY